jgi:hypothetical protein
MLRILAILMILPVLTACADEESALQTADADQEWIIVAGERIGPVDQGATREGLRRQLGADVVSDGEIYLGEGETRPGTVLFPGTSEELEIVWHTQDFRCPEMVRASAPGSRWSTEQGVRIGSSVAQVQAANGRSFSFWGFEWDLGGYVVDWSGGRLSDLGLRFTLPEGAVDRIGEAGAARFFGDVVVRSDDPDLPALAPVVETFFLTWPRVEECPVGAAAGTA